MSNWDIFELILVIPVLLFALFMAKQRASVFDDPMLLPDEPTWKPSYTDIAQAETLGPALKKVCVMTEARALRFKSHRPGIVHFSDKEPVMFPSYDWGNLGSALRQSIRTGTLAPLKKIFQPKLSDIETTYYMSFGVTLDGETTDLKKGSVEVQHHAQWLAERLGIECDVA
ncbi:MAG: hypothetical protein ACPGQS_06830 [Bradymonadia bacterium]